MAVLSCSTVDMGSHGTGAAKMGGVPTWIPVTCPTCGGLRDGEDGPPWPFHAKGFHACECDEDATPTHRLAPPPPRPGPDTAAGS